MIYEHGLRRERKNDFLKYLKMVSILKIKKRIARTKKALEACLLLRLMHFQWWVLQGSDL